MDVIRVVNDLTYWFDYSTYMVLHHPFTSLTTVVGAFLFYQGLGGVKLITTAITFALAGVTALFFDWLMF